jgi:hypothetical protein
LVPHDDAVAVGGSVSPSAEPTAGLRLYLELAEDLELGDGSVHRRL